MPGKLILRQKNLKSLKFDKKFQSLPNRRENQMLSWNLKTWDGESVRTLSAVSLS